MNVAVALRDPAERHTVLRALAAAGHQGLAVDNAKALLLQITDTALPVVLLDYEFAGLGMDQLLASIRAEGSAPNVVLAIPGRSGTEVSRAVAWGVEDFVRRPLWMPEVIARVERPRRGPPSEAPGSDPPAPANLLGKLPSWGTIELTITSEIAATLGGMALVPAPEPLWPPTRAARVILSLPTEAVEVEILLGVDSRNELALALAVYGAPANAAAIDDVLCELANASAGAFKRAALEDGKTFTLGLPSIVAGAADTGPVPARRWVAQSPSLTLQCRADVRSTRPESLPAGRLREGMVVTQNVRAPSGLLLVREGTHLTERTVDQLRNLLGVNHLVEVVVARAAG